jgi:hypothetical protein
MRQWKMHPCHGGRPMSSPSLPPEKLAAAEALARAIHEAAALDIDALARTLLDTDDASLFGATEFRIRALAHQIAAKAFEQHLAQKKTATTAPA